MIENTDHASLADYLDNRVFAGNTGIEIPPIPEEVAGFNAYIENFKKCLPIEEAATRCKEERLRHLTPAAPCHLCQVLQGRLQCT